MSVKSATIYKESAALSLLMAFGTATVFRACGPKDDGTWMHCHTAQNGAVTAGIVIAVIFLAAAFVKNVSLARVLAAAGIAGALAVMLIPGTLVTMCMMNTMRCYAVMQPFVRVMSVLVIISGAAGILAGRKD